jgi:hypothetical protein
MENKEIRRKNLLILLDELNTIVALAEHTGIAAAYLSQLLNQAPSANKTPRGMGSKTARTMEKKCGKANGWMDTLHAEDGGELVYITKPLYMNLLRAAQNAPDEVVADHIRGIDTTTQLIEQAKESKK